MPPPNNDLPSNDSPFGHMVFFTLGDSTPKARQKLIDDCHKFLSDHSGTVHFSAGQLADSTRDVNDRDFHVALHLVFASRAAHDAYQEAASHDEFIRENKENWTRVRVFDSQLSS